MEDILDFDLTNVEFVKNPYPVMAQLRSAGKPIWHNEMNMWLAPRHADANAVLRAKTLGRIFQPREPEELWETFNWLHADSILDSEPPKHTRLRALVAKAFNRGQIDRLAPRINQIVQDLLINCEIKLKENGNFDVIADFAEPLPVMVIAELLGVAPESQELLRPWSQAIVKMYEYGHTADQQAAARAAGADFAQLITQMVTERKQNPTDDLVTEFARVEESGEKLSLHELIATCVLLLNAGHEASVNGFGNGFVATMRDQVEVEKLKKNPRAIADTAVEEFLRFDAPLQLFERTATSDTEINGITVKTGQKIAALLGSANRDESIFQQPDRLDLTRNPNPHIGFGGGIHFCLGAPLARLEMTSSLPALFEKFPNMQLAAEPVMRPTFVLRGYESILVTA